MTTLTLAQSVKDMTGISQVTEAFAKQYVNDHYIPFLIYQRHLFRMDELRKKVKERPLRTRKIYTKNYANR